MNFCIVLWNIYPHFSALVFFFIVMEESRAETVDMKNDFGNIVSVIIFAVYEKCFRTKRLFFFFVVTLLKLTPAFVIWWRSHGCN